MELKKRDFLQIINHNRGTLRSLCKVYYADLEDQKDAFQDIVLQLWKSYDSFRGESEIGTWLYRVGLNTLLSKVRKEKRRVSAEPLDASHIYLTHGMADDNVELMTMMLQSLKDLDKAIVLLYLEGYGNKEIAEILKISQTNVGTRFNRIKSQLKVKFNHQSHES
ncbi:MAG: RNA polymerase sigma factor [Bacteroidota bacterium]